MNEEEYNHLSLSDDIPLASLCQLRLDEYNKLDFCLSPFFFIYLYITYYMSRADVFWITTTNDVNITVAYYYRH